MKRSGTIALVACFILGSACLSARSESPGPKDIPPDVAKTFDKQCAGCHSGMFAPKGLKLGPSKIAAAIDAPSKEMPKLKLIDTANPGESYLLKKIEGAEGIAGVKMPKEREMPAADLELIKGWILGLKAK